jgi:hypothetical protein
MWNLFRILKNYLWNKIRSYEHSDLLHNYNTWVSIIPFLTFYLTTLHLSYCPWSNWPNYSHLLITLLRGLLIKEFAKILLWQKTIVFCTVHDYDYDDQRLLSMWKMSNYVGMPKSTPVQSLNNRLRPIPLISILSKVAEEFVIREQLKPGHSGS